MGILYLKVTYPTRTNIDFVALLVVLFILKKYSVFILIILLCYLFHTIKPSYYFLVIIVLNINFL